MQTIDDVLFHERDHRQSASEREGADGGEERGDAPEGRLRRDDRGRAQRRPRNERHENEDDRYHDENDRAEALAVEEEEAGAAGEQQDRRRAERTQEGGDRGPDRNESMRPGP